MGYWVKARAVGKLRPVDLSAIELLDQGPDTGAFGPLFSCTELFEPAIIDSSVPEVDCVLDDIFNAVHGVVPEEPSLIECLVPEAAGLTHVFQNDGPLIGSVIAEGEPVACVIEGGEDRLVGLRVAMKGIYDVLAFSRDGGAVSQCLEGLKPVDERVAFNAAHNLSPDIALT